MARLIHHPGLCATLFALVTMADVAQATDLSWSAFGTVGAAVSDRDELFQGYIDSDGTLERDTVFGGQVDAQFSPEWSGTLQVKLAPSQRREDEWDVSASWAFLSWRPSNEWLVRVGKLRVPLYLFSENLDVGQSYDLARMPNETYSIAPTADITGLYVTRNWALPASELSLDVYSGRARVSHRSHSRDTGAAIQNVRTTVTGGVVSWRTEDVTLRAGLAHASTDLDAPGTPTALQATPLGGGVTAYLPIGFTQRISNDLLTLGADWRLPEGWRVLAEYQRSVQHKTELGINTYGGHVAVLKTVARWTPYVALASLKSASSQDRLRSAVAAVDVPSFVPGADELMAGQRALVDGTPFYDQYSLALGTSFALTPRSKVKAEWMHARIQNGSSMVDSPSGPQPLKDVGINVLSLSYSFAF